MTTWNEKYRPQLLDDLWQVGNAGIESLKLLLYAAMLQQLLILVGEFGCGKTTIGRIVGQRYLCVSPEHLIGVPCGTCEGCRSLSPSTSGTIAIDGYLEYDASALSASHILDSIRTHVGSNRLSPPPNHRFRQWVVCIDEMVHAETRLQFALVKIVENVARARFILCYSDAAPIIGALRSRALIVNLPPATAEQAVIGITTIADREGYEISVGPARVLADSMRRIPRDCIKALEVAARLSSDKQISLAAVNSAIALSQGTQ